MNEILLRNAHVIDPAGPFHGQNVDVRIVDGRIAAVGTDLELGNAAPIAMDGLHIGPGWVETRAHFRDPGEEYKQGIPAGLDEAARGGFTAVAILPSTHPVADQRSAIQYTLARAADHVVRALPLGALTKGMQGQQLAEHFDMQRAGAVAFCDDQHPVRNTRLMLLALQYTANFNGRVISFAQDPDLLALGQMHEGPMSTRLGLRGIAPMAESIQLARDIELLEYTGGTLHVATVSTAAGVELIRRAKAKGLRITASVNALHLLLDDGCLRGFDSTYKLMPPLRDPEHMEALRQGVKDGTLDTITSDHRPEDVEHKKLEFPQAAFGAIGLATAFATARTVMAPHMSLAELLARFTTGPRAALGLPQVHIAEGEKAEITLFQPDLAWSVQENELRGASRNTPLIGHRLVGRPLGVINGTKSFLAPVLHAH